MTQILQEYLDLKYRCVDYLEKYENKNTIISTILKLYSKDINSCRAMALVQSSSSSLIKLLEKRALLSYSKPDPLYNIAKLMDSTELTGKILEYKDKLQSNSLPIDQSYYRLLYKADAYKDIENNGNNNENKLDEMIYEAVTESIGSSWKTMARYLKIQESVIDNLHREHGTDMKTIVREIFNKYRRNHPKVWIPQVCKALEKSRRSDLKEVIEELVLQYEENI